MLYNAGTDDNNQSNTVAALLFNNLLDSDRMHVIGTGNGMIEDLDIAQSFPFVVGDTLHFTSILMPTNVNAASPNSEFLGAATPRSYKCVIRVLA